jgi:hypothetical protein
MEWKKEIWKVIPGTEAMYEACIDGRIRSVPRTVPHSTSGTLTLPGKELNPMIGIGGYHYVTICIKAKRKKKYNHELVCAAFYGERPIGHHIDHIDKNRLNNNLFNLRYVTVLRNCSMPGSKHPHALLNEDQVRDIKSRYIPRIITLKMLAQEYHVDESTISLIIRGKNWKHVS